jgi:hypothetical protein
MPILNYWFCTQLVMLGSEHLQLQVEVGVHLLRLLELEGRLDVRQHERVLDRQVHFVSFLVIRILMVKFGLGFLQGG